MATRQDVDRKARLKSELQALMDRVDSMKQFDKLTEIHTYCDDLEIQVQVITESVIRQVNATQECLLSEIASYRNSLVASVEKSKKPKKPTKLDEEIAALSEEIQAFGTQCSEYFAQPSLEKSVYKSNLTQANGLKKKAQELRSKIRSQAFNKKFLTLLQGDFFHLKSDLIARLELSNVDLGNEMIIKHIVIDKATKTAEVFQIDQESRRSEIRDLLFLPDGNLALSIRDFDQRHPIKLWDTENKRMLCDLDSIEGPVYDTVDGCRRLCLLPSGDLLGCSAYGFFDSWDVETRQCTNSIDLDFYRNRPDAFGFKVMSTGEIIFQMDEQLVGLDALSTYFDHTDIFHFSKKFFGKVEEIRDDKFATLDWSGKSYGLWDLHSGQKLKSGTLPKREKINSLNKILSDGQVIRCFEDGTVEFFDMIRAKQGRTFRQDLGRIVKVIELPDNTLLCVHLTGPRFKVLRMERDNQEPIEYEIYSFDVSPDGKFLAAGCNRSALIIWPLDA